MDRGGRAVTVPGSLRPWDPAGGRSGARRAAAAPGLAQGGAAFFLDLDQTLALMRPDLHSKTRMNRGISMVKCPGKI